jgi:hypothetical protein
VERLQADLLAARAAAPANPPRSVSPAVRAPADDPPAAHGLFSVPDTQHRPGWSWVWVGVLAGLGAGFALGWRVLDRRIRAKYGGLRIY